MRLLVGLGNPGPKYRNNRHNIGFMAVDEIVRRHDFSAPRSRFQSEAYEGSVAGEKVLALKPTTFVNESGRAVGEAARFYKLAASDIIVVHDEIDLAAGKVRVKRGGGSAGHRGLRSIDAHLGTPDYVRVRLGIGHPGDKERVHGHVLGDFAKQDRGWLDAELEAVAQALPVLLAGRESDFMSQVAMAVQAATPGDRQPAAGPATRGRPDKGQPADPGDPPQTSLGAALNRALSRLRGG